MSRGGSYLPLEKVLGREQGFVLDNRVTWEVNRVRFRSPLYDLANSMRKRGHGAKERGVCAKKVLEDTEKVCLDLHALRENTSAGSRKPHNSG